MEPLRADLVLEGGGVKGIGLVGAVSTLARAGYTFPRVAGTSAGAVVGAFLVALQRAGEPLERLSSRWRSSSARSPWSSVRRSGSTAPRTPRASA
jgi:NTE family protein